MDKEPASVKVVARIRPFSDREWREAQENHKDPSESYVSILDDETIESGMEGTHTSRFTFDRVFGPASTQHDVYNYVALPVINDTLRGYNGTIFAYGQTGTGKTYTMEGPLLGDETYMGIIPRTINDLFEKLESRHSDTIWSVKVSYYEIYMEEIRDLLDSSFSLTASPKKRQIRRGHRLPISSSNPFAPSTPGPMSSAKKIKIYEDRHGNTHIRGLSKYKVHSKHDVIKILRVGSAARVSAANKMNDRSSRSHAILTLEIEQKNVSSSYTIVRSRLHLVDLAGSEKVSKTEAEGLQLEEAKNINLSLLTLGNVVNCLSSGMGTRDSTGSVSLPAFQSHSHIPYRDSKLTRVLRESLGGNSRTVVIVACSPSPFNATETLSTLKFAARAKTIKNKPEINKELSVSEMRMLLDSSRHRISKVVSFLKRMRTLVDQGVFILPVDVEVELKSVLDSLETKESLSNRMKFARPSSAGAASSASSSVASRALASSHGGRSVSFDSVPNTPSYAQQSHPNTHIHTPYQSSQRFNSIVSRRRASVSLCEGLASTPINRRAVGIGKESEAISLSLRPPRSGKQSLVTATIAEEMDDDLGGRVIVSSDEDDDVTGTSTSHSTMMGAHGMYRPSSVSSTSDLDIMPRGVSSSSYTSLLLELERVKEERDHMNVCKKVLMSVLSAKKKSIALCGDVCEWLGDRVTAGKTLTEREIRLLQESLSQREEEDPDSELDSGILFGVNASGSVSGAETGPVATRQFSSTLSMMLAVHRAVRERNVEDLGRLLERVEEEEVRRKKSYSRDSSVHEDNSIPLSVELINFQDPVNGYTALHYAVDVVSVRMVRLLLCVKGIRVDIRDKDGYTPLHHCAMKFDCTDSEDMNGDGSLEEEYDEDLDDDHDTIASGMSTTRTGQSPRSVSLSTTSNRSHGSATSTATRGTTTTTTTTTTQLSATTSLVLSGSRVIVGELLERCATDGVDIDILSHTTPPLSPLQLCFLRRERGVTVGAALIEAGASVSSHGIIKKLKSRLALEKKTETHGAIPYEGDVDSVAFGGISTIGSDALKKKKKPKFSNALLLSLLKSNPFSLPHSAASLSLDSWLVCLLNASLLHLQRVKTLSPALGESELEEKKTLISPFSPFFLFNGSSVLHTICERGDGECLLVYMQFIQQHYKQLWEYQLEYNRSQMTGKTHGVDDSDLLRPSSHVLVPSLLAQLSEDGLSPLWVCFIHNNTHTLNTLIQLGADTNKKRGSDGAVLFLEALRNREWDWVKTLLSAHTRLPHSSTPSFLTDITSEDEWGNVCHVLCESLCTEKARYVGKEGDIPEDVIDLITVRFAELTSDQQGQLLLTERGKTNGGTISPLSLLFFSIPSAFAFLLHSAEISYQQAPSLTMAQRTVLALCSEVIRSGGTIGNAVKRRMEELLTQIPFLVSSAIKDATIAHKKGLHEALSPSDKGKSTSSSTYTQTKKPVVRSSNLLIPNKSSKSTQGEDKRVDSISARAMKDFEQGLSQCISLALQWVCVIMEILNTPSSSKGHRETVIYPSAKNPFPYISSVVIDELISVCIQLGVVEILPISLRKRVKTAGHNIVLGKNMPASSDLDDTQSATAISPALASPSLRSSLPSSPRQHSATLATSATSTVTPSLMSDVAVCISLSDLVSLNEKVEDMTKEQLEAICVYEIGLESGHTPASPTSTFSPTSTLLYLCYSLDCAECAKILLKKSVMGSSPGAKGKYGISTPNYGKKKGILGGKAEFTANKQLELVLYEIMSDSVSNDEESWVKLAVEAGGNPFFAPSDSAECPYVIAKSRGNSSILSYLKLKI
ncbi:Kinesin heavy chain [Aduncisulcus paluster]|uniref:Kinesin heavy chain n=1 Tax=Aduncisulcus paluster TaxID=2918883 RepID=A0ABQ5KG95_9EUKA|nr:Kinesin heavy chain [Aduncisulcus paluster]